MTDQGILQQQLQWGFLSATRNCIMEIDFEGNQVVNMTVSVYLGEEDE